MQLNETQAAELRQLLFNNVYVPAAMRKCAELGVPLESEADFEKFSETIGHLRRVRQADGGETFVPPAPSRYDGVAEMAKRAFEEVAGFQPDTTAIREWVQKEAAAVTAASA